MTFEPLEKIDNPRPLYTPNIVLDRLIATGWGDTAQEDIPADVMEAAMQGGTVRRKYERARNNAAKGRRKLLTML